MEMPLDGVEAETGPEEIGEAGIEAESEDIAVEPEYDYLDVDEATGAKYVTVKIDGEDVSVPLNEALQGYSRESAATKRFQEASEMRKQADEALRLQQAFRADPGLTVQILARQAGMGVEQFLGLTPAQQKAAVSDEDQYLDPLERQLNEERQSRLALEERFEQREADERLAYAVNGLKQQFSATDEQARAVVGQAMNMGLGIESFPMIFQSMAYQASQQATAQHTASQAAETQARQVAAQRAAQTVGSGASVPNTSQTQAPVKYNSIREAANAAIDEVEARAAR